MAQLTKRYGSLPHSATIACFSWLTVVNHQNYQAFVKKHPEQHNRPDLSPGCFGPHAKLDQR